MAIKIAIANQKGGVGKTTTAVSLTNALYLKGKKVLLIDLDPQCNSTDTMNGITQNKETLIDCFEGTATVKDTIQKTPWGDLLPCDELLDDAEKRYTKVSAPFMLQTLLKSIDEKYDYIIMDTPPYRGILLSNALVVANELIIPISLDRYSMQGLNQLKETIEEIQQHFNPHLHVMGILATRVKNNTKVAKEVEKLLPDVAHFFNTIYFNVSIPESVKCPESITAKIPLISYDETSSPAQAYLDLAAQIIEMEAK